MELTWDSLVQRKLYVVEINHGGFVECYYSFGKNDFDAVKELMDTTGDTIDGYVLNVSRSFGHTKDVEIVDRIKSYRIAGLDDYDRVVFVNEVNAHHVNVRMDAEWIEFAWKRLQTILE